MPLTGTLYGFTRENVDNAPAEPGVYVLYQDGNLIYIGSATISIRTRLQRHYNGDEGRCTKSATSYRREVTSRPRSRESELIQEYKDEHYGQLPKCNDVTP